jgi:hypothetical protein
MDTTALRRPQRLLLGAGKREIGWAGTLSRVAGGAVAVGLPIATHPFGWREAVAAFVALPLLAVITAAGLTAAFGKVAPKLLERQHLICSAPGCLLIALMVAAAAGLDVLIGANGNVSLWVWLGSGMLLAAARGYGGCEVLAIPNLLTGRRDRIGCLLYTPIDRLERAHKRSVSATV